MVQSTVRWTGAVLMAAMLVSAGCRHMCGADASTSVASGLPQASESARAGTAGSVQAVAAGKLSGLTLADIVDIALSNNPTTRAAWADARAAAARHAAARGAYLPTVELMGTYTRTGAPFQDASSSYGPAVSLSYLVFDLGGRGAKVDSLRQSLAAADLEHAAAMRYVVLSVEKACFRYLAAKAMLVSLQAGQREAQAHLDVASERHKAGLGTVADVLKAKASLSRTQLDLQSAEGDLSVTRGALALAMGLAANTGYDLGEGVGDIPVRPVTGEVEGMIEMAVSNRADLAAARARVLAGEAHVAEVRSRNLPSLSAAGRYGRAYVDGTGNDDSYEGGLVLSVPLFSGLSGVNEVEEARFLAMSQQERAKAMEQQVVYQVFSAYFSLQTAARRTETAGDMLASASQAHDAAMALYKQGLVTMTDVLSAQSLLADARAQQISARFAWLVSLAQLAHDVGGTDAGKDNPFSFNNQSAGEGR
ncbi:MAG: TolC family protein [bacterium]